MANLLGLHPGVRKTAQEVVRVGRSFGIRPRITSGFRSLEEQNRLFKKRGKIFPAAAPGFSQHNYGLAVDIIDGSRRPGGQSLLIQIARELGFQTVSSDPIHFQVFSTPDFLQILRQIQTP